MAKTKLKIGEIGFVAHGQLWLCEVRKHVNLYVEPRFLSKAEAKPGMLRVTALASQAHPGGLYYGIYLPGHDLFKPIQLHVTPEAAKQRSLIHVPRVFVLSKTPGKEPFPTPDFFYFGSAK
jgi:hypothetical protein